MKMSEPSYSLPVPDSLHRHTHHYRQGSRLHAIFRRSSSAMRDRSPIFADQDTLRRIWMHQGATKRAFPAYRAGTRSKTEVE